jgi:two-component sensor histidine kinase
MVQTFALALHELATNAVKYGALSDRGGQLAVCWEVRHDDARGAQLWVDWRESGVSDMPSPEAPARGNGYGRELIERALPYQLGARTSYAFETDGVHCTIEVPVPAEHVAAERSDG